MLIYSSFNLYFLSVKIKTEKISGKKSLEKRRFIKTLPIFWQKWQKVDFNFDLPVFNAHSIKSFFSWKPTFSKAKNGHLSGYSSQGLSQFISFPGSFWVQFKSLTLKRDFFINWNLCKVLLKGFDLKRQLIKNLLSLLSVFPRLNLIFESLIFS